MRRSFVIFLLLFILLLISLISFVPRENLSIFEFLGSNELCSSYDEAIATIVTSRSFLPGAVTLAYSLRNHSPHRKKIAIVPQEFQSHNLTSSHLQLLERVGWNVLLMADIPLPINSTFKPEKARWNDMLLKLVTFNMTQYSRIVMLDVDILVRGNFDYAFQRLCKSEYNIAAVQAPTRPRFPMHHLIAGHFNGGVLFIKPNSTLFKDLIDKSGDPEMYPAISFAEQSFLNNYFMSNWESLPIRYNFAHSRVYEIYYQRFKNESIITHFVGNVNYKPWFPCNGTVCAEEDPFIDSQAPDWRREFARAIEFFSILNSEIIDYEIVETEPEGET